MEEAEVRELVPKIKKDICLLYHELEPYGAIHGILDHGEFTGPYWRYLNLGSATDEERQFIREGCLVMILEFITDCMDEGGSYPQPNFVDWRARVAFLDYEDEDQAKLVQTVLLALDTVLARQPEPPEIVDLRGWVFKRYVRRYFQERAGLGDESQKEA